MEAITFDRKKVIEDMEALKSKAMEALRGDAKATGDIETNVEDVENCITVKYLGKIGLSNEQGEIVDKDWYAVIKQQGGQFQITYYAENQIYLGQQQGMDGKIQSVWELPQKMKDLKKEDIESAKTLEELEEEQKQEEQEQGTGEQEGEESQQLPGVEDEGPQLTKTQVDRMKGPKTSLNQIVDAETLGNIIGLEGQYMQIVDADIVRKLIPDLQIPSSQRTIPIEILPDGSANVIGEDKLQFSRQEGTNSTAEHATATNEGLLRNEQNLETYNIVSRGGMHTIAVGYDENGGMPLEMKYGWRNVEEPNKIAYSELETVHEGPMVQDDDTYQFQKDASEGIEKPNTISEEDVIAYIKANGGPYIFDQNGNLAGFDIEGARAEIAEDGRPIEEIIEDLDVKTRMPEEYGPKSHY